MSPEDILTTRILNVLPARSVELSTFLSLFRIRLTEKEPTACVTCADEPELRLNPDFVAGHCHTDEHLFMLVMHELYHVILGHTTLFPRSTPVLNIVFDAVINALLCHEFPEPEYTSFFTDYYPPDRLPYALLRPPEPGVAPPAAARHALELLYGDVGLATYHDVFLALAAEMKGVLVVASGGLDGGDLPVLLGSHGSGESSADGKDAGNPLDQPGGRTLKDLIEKAIEKWPCPKTPVSGCDQGTGAAERTFDGESATDIAVKAALRSLLRRATLPGPREHLQPSMRDRPCETTTFQPVWSDRSHEARSLVQGASLLYRRETATSRFSLRTPGQAFVYLDVSGSVTSLVAPMADVLLPFVRRKLCAIHVFSTVVEETSIEGLREHRFVSTGGTDIECVLRHVLDMPRAKRPASVVLLTDGAVGTPPAGLLEAVRRTRIRFYAGIFSSLRYGHDYLKDLVTASVEIPI